MMAPVDNRLDAWLEAIGDRLNPVLVKETRQVLKSRQFLGAFLLMLAAAWLISMAFALPQGENLSLYDAGPGFFRVYYAVLMLCLCFVVPAGVFRSMTGEFLEQTFEVLVVTPLSPQRIVFGKLQSAMVQMAVYYSAIAPFVCFTYMLRGIGLLEILFLLVLSFVGSLSVCLFALMFGALAKKSYWESVCLLGVLGIGGVAFTATVGIAAAVNNAGSLLIGLFCFGVAFLYFALLTIGVATAQLTPTMPVPRLVVAKISERTA